MTKKQAIRIFSLDNSTLRFHDVTGFQFAANWSYLPAHYHEAILLAQVLPLVFRRNPAGTLELGILLTRKGRHIIQQGHWPINIKPTLLSIYPFTWASIGDGQTRLAYYPDAEHFKGKGQKLVTSKKKPTQKLFGYLNQLKKIQSAFSSTANALMELDKHQLLSENGDYLILSQQPEQEVLEQLSPELKKLLQIHINSLKHIAPDTVAAAAAIQESPAKQKQGATKKKTAAKSKKTDKEKKKSPAKKKAKTKKAGGLEGIINQVCDSFSVEIEELKGRKRSGNLTEARIKLAEESKQSGLLEPMAEWLQRSPSTLNSWLREA